MTGTERRAVVVEVAGNEFLSRVHASLKHIRIWCGTRAGERSKRMKKKKPGSEITMFEERGRRGILGRLAVPSFIHRNYEGQKPTMQFGYGHGISPCAPCGHPRTIFGERR